MVIDDLDVEGIAISPAKANAPLVIDANTVLAGALPFKSLESIGGRDAKVPKDASAMDHPEFA